MLPPTLKMKKELQAWWATLPRYRNEAEVRRAVEVLNEQIRRINSRPAEGPPSTVGPIDLRTAVERWRTLKG